MRSVAETKSLQEHFDYVVSNLLKQGCVSRTYHETQGREICAYRGDDGRKCAAGWLIPDEAYTPDMEGMDIGDVLARHPQALPNELHEDTAIDLVAELQNIHDNYNPVGWRQSFSRVALEFNLSNAVCKAEAA